MYSIFELSIYNIFSPFMYSKSSLSGGGIAPDSTFIVENKYHGIKFITNTRHEMKDLLHQ